MPPPPRPSGICKSHKVMIPDNMAKIKDKKVEFKEAKGKKAQNSFLRIVEWPMMKESQSCQIPAVFPCPTDPLHLSGPQIPHLYGKKKKKNIYLDRFLVVLISSGSGVITKLLLFISLLIGLHLECLFSSDCHILRAPWTN